MKILKTEKQTEKELSVLLDNWWIKTNKTEYGYQVKEYLKKHLLDLIVKSGLKI